MSAGKKRRAPRGYARGAEQVFNLHNASGEAYPPIAIPCYLNKSTGAVLGLDLSNVHQGRLERATMAEWREAVTKVLLARIRTTEPTRHIAVVAVACHGVYRLAFWPVLRQIALDGSAHWKTVMSSDECASLPRSNEIQDFHWQGTDIWRSFHPSETGDRQSYRATILDWSPSTWDTLVQVRRLLDEAIAKIGDLVTTPALLAAHTQKLLAGQ